MKLGIREIAIDACLEEVAARMKAGRLAVVEIGCMFSESKSASTLRIARSLRSWPKTRRFISVDYDPRHVAAAKEIVRACEPELSDDVEFRCGHSLVVLPEVLEELGEVDFALLDGGAHPEVCLQEFELVIERLAPHGLVVVDDVVAMAPTDAYPRARPFGKGTLILPMLALIDYLRTRGAYRHGNAQFCEEGQGAADSALIGQLPATGLIDALDGVHYAALARKKHRVLLAGRAEPLEGCLQRLDESVNVLSSTGVFRAACKPPAPAKPVRPAGRIRRALRKVLHRR